MIDSHWRETTRIESKQGGKIETKALRTGRKQNWDLVQCEGDGITIARWLFVRDFQG